MSVAPNAFSLFTAYQFLSLGMLISALESKMRPFPSCVYQRLCALMMEMIATSYYFAYCVSNFEFWFYIFKGTWQIRFCKLQYNTCGRRTKVFSAPPDHMFIISFARLTTYGGWCISYLRYSYFSPFFFISSLTAEWFSLLFTSWKQDHISIIRHLNLTTYLTINRTGVHGDKSVREYEKAVFA